MEEKEFYSVKEVAKKCGLSEHTVRYYTNLGFIPNLSRDSNGYRVFDNQALGFLKTVKCLRETGMSLRDIKKYIDLVLIGDSTVPTRYEIILKQKENVKAKLEEINKQMDFIEYKLNFYRKKMNMEE